MYLPMPLAARFSSSELMASVVLPFSANSRNAFSPATPLLFVFARLIIADVMEEKTTISSRARETATFRRRQPPTWLSGPKLSETLPARSGP